MLLNKLGVHINKDNILCEGLGVATFSGMRYLPETGGFGVSFMLQPTMPIVKEDGTEGTVKLFAIDPLVFCQLREHNGFRLMRGHHVYLDFDLLLRDLGYEGVWSKN